MGKTRKASFPPVVAAEAYFQRPPGSYSDRLLQFRPREGLPALKRSTADAVAEGGEGRWALE